MACELCFRKVGYLKKSKNKETTKTNVDCQILLYVKILGSFLEVWSQQCHMSHSTLHFFPLGRL